MSNETPVPAYDLKRQALWEMESTRRAQRRYQEVAAVSDPSTLPSGKRILREVIPPLREAILVSQAEAQDLIKSPGGPAKHPWAWPIQLLNAEQLSLITLAVALNAVRDQEGHLSAISQVAPNMSRGVREEIEYRTWVADQTAANKAAKAAGDEEHENVLAKFKHRYPTVHRNVWLRWKRKLEEFQTVGWDKITAIHLGTKMVDLLVKAAPHRFEVGTRSITGGRTQLYLRLSEETLEMMRDIETRAEVARPLLMPMLMPPLPWRYET